MRFLNCCKAALQLVHIQHLSKGTNMKSVTGMFTEHLEDVSLLLEQQHITCLLIATLTYFQHLKMLFQMSGIS